VDQFARLYTPIVVAVALLVAIIPPLVFGATWLDWIYKALVLLVIACPCALVISTPVSIVSGLAAAARRGILIADAQALERAQQVDFVVFDKTGTLTVGRPRVTSVEPASGIDADMLLDQLAALQAENTHPLAQA
ncbi:HAD-IC family P-type ATPase, partial [Escherichia coli]|uniref:HAD-IC family P-type ATPase n=1 Tax=Escherichia coli TaxID=562 RepID=UPI00135E33C7